jgi:hypothetical protein
MLFVALNDIDERRAGNLKRLFKANEARRIEIKEEKGCLKGAQLFQVFLRASRICLL